MHIPSQIRSEPPSAYETALCQALMAVLGRNVHDLAGIAAGLAQGPLRPEAGGSWTEETLTRELARLGGGPQKSAVPEVRDVEGLKITPTPLAAGAPAKPSYEQTVDRLLATGLRNKWWCIAPSWLVKDKPVGLTRLGEKIVLWRDAAGQVHVHKDMCPHRGAPLSAGLVYDGKLTCIYHGVQVAGDGTVANVPAFPGCHLEGQHLVKAYPVIEHYQGIWAYFGDEANPDPVPFTLPYELTSDDWTGFVYTNTWRGNYQFIFDNLVDPMHAPYLHAESFTLAYGAKRDEVEVKPTQFGFEVGRKGQRELNFDWLEFADTGGFFVRVDIFYPPATGPGGILRVVCFVTPIDERSTQIHFWRSRKVQGWQADLWRFLFKTKLEEYAGVVLEQDRLMVEQMPGWPVPENLYQHDIGVSRIRRTFRRMAESQARALGHPAAASAAE